MSVFGQERSVIGVCFRVVLYAHGNIKVQFCGSFRGNLATPRRTEILAERAESMATPVVKTLPPYLPQPLHLSPKSL